MGEAFSLWHPCYTAAAAAAAPAAPATATAEVEGEGVKLPERVGVRLAAPVREPLLCPLPLRAEDADRAPLRERAGVAEPVGRLELTELRGVRLRHDVSDWEGEGERVDGALPDACGDAEVEGSPLGEAPPVPLGVPDALALSDAEAEALAPTSSGDRCQSTAFVRESWRVPRARSESAEKTENKPRTIPTKCSRQFTSHLQHQ
jgi:hypothetical protein